MKAKKALACIAGDRPVFPPRADRDGSTGERRKKEKREKKGKGRMYPNIGGVCAEAVPLPPLVFLDFFARFALSMSGMSRWGAFYDRGVIQLLLCSMQGIFNVIFQT